MPCGLTALLLVSICDHREFFSKPYQAFWAVRLKVGNGSAYRSHVAVVVVALEHDMTLTLISTPVKQNTEKIS